MQVDLLRDTLPTVNLFRRYRWNGWFARDGAKDKTLILGTLWTIWFTLNICSFQNLKIDLSTDTSRTRELAPALRILGLCHNIANAEANFRHETDEEFENTEMFVAPEEVSVDRILSQSVDTTQRRALLQKHTARSWQPWFESSWTNPTSFAPWETLGSAYLVLCSMFWVSSNQCGTPWHATWNPSIFLLMRILDLFAGLSA
jgi:hypothetical protein